MAMEMPISFSSLSRLMAFSGLSMMTLSVISSSRHDGWRPVSPRIPRMLSVRLSCVNCRHEMLTEILICANPASCQALACVQAFLSTHSPIGMISPVSSASGMNVSGRISPFCGCCQRIRASTPTILPVVVLTRGW